MVGLIIFILLIYYISIAIQSTGFLIYDPYYFKGNKMLIPFYFWRTKYLFKN